MPADIVRTCAVQHAEPAGNYCTLTRASLCSATETLDAEDKFSCDTCGCLQEAQKRIKIKQLPKVLCLHLKRFKYVEDLQR